MADIYNDRAVTRLREAFPGWTERNYDFAALVIAGLQADGLTRISRIEHIDRGYESIERDLGALGAHVRQETGT